MSVHPTTGAVGPDVPRLDPEQLGRQGRSCATPENFYVGAEGTGGGVFDGRIAGPLSDGAQLWKDTCLGATQALTAFDGVLYSGHHAHDCAPAPGGFPDGPRHHMLAQSIADKTILPWFPDTDGGLGEALGPR